MNIEEAKEILGRIDIKFFLSGMIEQNNYIVDKADEVNIAIYTVLNELDKYRDRIDELINEVTIKDSEIELKDKVINLMAGNLTTDYHDISWVEDYYYNMAQEILEK